MKFVVLIFLFSSLCFAQAEGDQDQTKNDEIKKTVEKIDNKKTENKKNRNKKDEKDDSSLEDMSHPNLWSLFGSYAWIDTWIPGKFGVSAVYGNKNRTYELAYQSAAYSFDFVIDGLGKISDKRIHLTTRSFTFENSFNFQYGAFYNSVDITLGDKYMRLVGAQYDALKISTAGGIWGFGNRWSWDNGFNFGIDYFKIFWPFKTLEKKAPFLTETDNDDDKDDAEKLLNTISKTPTISLFFVEIGYTF
jgi:hypothetical protein